MPTKVYEGKEATMLKRKRLSRHHPEELVRRARSGMIADSDWLAVEILSRTKEATRAVAAAKKCIRVGTRGTDELKVTELLKHIRRYCAWQGLEYDELDSNAGQLYEQEMTEERPRCWWLDAPDPRRAL